MAERPGDEAPPDAPSEAPPPWVEAGWYVACPTRRLRRGPLRAELLGRPIVLFRGADGVPAALVDRCPHRNMPLSAGTVRGGALECGYHGWRFDARGRCVAVPGLAAGGAADRPARAAEPLATRERDGWLWVWSRPGARPAGEPPACEADGLAEGAVLRYSASIPAGLVETAENVLDVPHTAFLHRGLFRGAGAPREITASVRRGRDRAEVHYLGEPRPEGLLARLLAPGGGELCHVDRFILPSITEVSYRLGRRFVVATSRLTPESRDRTRLNASVRWSAALPAPLLRPLLAPLAWLVLRQDRRALALQSATIARFGGATFTSTELDLMAPEITRLLRLDRRGALPEAEAGEVRRVTLRV